MLGKSDSKLRAMGGVGLRWETACVLNYPPIESGYSIPRYLTRKPLPLPRTQPFLTIQSAKLYWNPASTDDV